MTQRQADEWAGPATQLRRLQQDLQNYMFGEAGAIADPVQAAIVDAPPLPVCERLGIYRNAYHFLFEFDGDRIKRVHAFMNTKTAEEALMPLLWGDRRSFD